MKQSFRMPLSLNETKLFNDGMYFKPVVVPVRAEW